MSVIPNVEATTLHEFLVANAEPGSTVVTDGWSAYPEACRDWFERTAPRSPARESRPTSCSPPSTALRDSRT